MLDQISAVNAAAQWGLSSIAAAPMAWRIYMEVLGVHLFLKGEYMDAKLKQDFAKRHGTERDIAN
jgi:hypothetical protein